MNAHGDVESVNLSTGERCVRVVGNGESRLVPQGNAKRDRRRKLKAKRQKRVYPGNYTPLQENDWIGWGVRRRNVARLERIRNQE